MTGPLVGGSVSFDHAADVYDETRALPPEIASKATDAVLAELRAAGAGRLLEVGIGTGRIARPLMERGVRVTGVDLAPRMLARLREQLTPQHTPPDLLFGDATRLPLRDASFPAVLFVHVLHLVSDWRRAVREARRVLAPGGVLLQDVTHYNKDNPWEQVFAKRSELLAALGFAPRVRPKDDELASYTALLGGTQKRVTYAEREFREAAHEVIDRARRRVDSWTWEIPDEIYPAFLAQYEAHARKTLGGLDATNVTHIKYGIDVWSFA